MAETTSPGSKRSRAKAKGSEEENAATEASEETTGVETQDAEQDASQGDGESSADAQAGDGEQTPEPPAASDPQGAGPADAGEAVDVSEGGEVSHAVLLANPQLLGDYPPEAVRGVLSGAADPISVGDARTAVASFLESPVVPEPTSTEEA
jgi:hypothetical protein